MWTSVSQGGAARPHVKWRAVCLTLMLVAHQGQKPILAQDGDSAFWRVDTRTPAHELPPATGADAVNCRFEDGKVWPRLGISQQAWGQIFAYTPINLIPSGQELYPSGHDPVTSFSFQLPAGEYFYVPGANEVSASGPNGQIATSGIFTVPTGGGTITISGQAGQSVTAAVYASRPFNVCAYVRFPDPTTGVDTEVLLTDDWRDRSGEDGGRGRAWKIVAGNGPVEIPLNGNDVYGTARLISCDQALICLRQDNERHYFPAANIVGTNTIQLNCEPAWHNGDQVYFLADQTVGSDLTGGTKPLSGTFCYVYNAGNNQIKLFGAQGDAIAGSGGSAYTFTGGMGRFYLERRAARPGPGGNGAPPLIAQSNASGDTWDDVGFLEVPEQIYVSATSSGTPKVVTAPNHRMIAGDSVNFFAPGTPMSGTPANGSSAWYAYPLDGNNLILYTTQTDALGNTGSNYASVPGFSLGQYVVRTTASGQPMPSAREGYYTATQQTVLVVGANGIYVSDPLDPLHYEPLNDTFTANLGDSESVTAVSGISGIDCLVILKTNSVYVLYNFSQGPGSWQLVRVTSDYGCIAPLSVATWGNNLMFLSRRGYDRVIGGAFGLIQQAEKPVSWDMKKYTDAILWAAAPSATAAVWNNRLFLALPIKAGLLNQSDLTFATTQNNNAVLALNFLNSNPMQDKFGWEGIWLGEGLACYGFAIHPIAGEDRLTFVDYNGNVNWFSDGWADPGPTPITYVFTTRAYFKGENVVVIKGEVNWDTFNPDITVDLQMAGVNEIETLGQFQYQNNVYQISNATPYDPSAPTASGWIAPYRADYSPGANELLVAQLDTLQNTTEPLRARTRGRSPQLVFTNTAGAMKLVRAQLAAKQVQVRGTTT